MISDDYTFEGPTWKAQVRAVLALELEPENVEILAEQADAVRLGRAVYGNYDENDSRDMYIEALAELRDYGYYVSREMRRARRRYEHYDARPARSLGSRLRAAALDAVVGFAYRVFGRGRS